MAKVLLGCLEIVIRFTQQKLAKCLPGLIVVLGGSKNRSECQPWPVSGVGKTRSCPRAPLRISQLAKRKVRFRLIM